MELSPPGEDANCASTEEIASILWNPQVHHRVHKSPPLFPVLSQINLVQTTPSYLSNIHLNQQIMGGRIPLLCSVTEKTKQETSMKQEYGGDTLLRNVSWAFNGLHGVLSQKIQLFITTAVITTNAI
jgi:hypothetical protein